MRVTLFRRVSLVWTPRAVGSSAPSSGWIPARYRPVAQSRRCFELAGALLVMACSKPTETVVRDTEGQRYRAVCSKDETCSIERVAGSQANEELVLHSPGRIVGVCTKSSGNLVLASCRPLGCQSENDCPAAHGLEHGACIGGLCVEPSQGLVTADAVMLCLAGTGAPSNQPLQVERYAMALNCGSPCKVPAPCRQP